MWCYLDLVSFQRQAPKMTTISQSHTFLHPSQTNIFTSASAFKLMAYTIISTVSQMTTLLKSVSIPTLTTSAPSLYFDVEGINLSRHGSISIIELHHKPSSRPDESHRYLIDVHILGFLAFSTPSAEGVSLKMILESPKTPKVFFDVRTDSDAMYALFGIKLAGIIDLQLMEVASRSWCVHIHSERALSFVQYLN